MKTFAALLTAVILLAAGCSQTATDSFASWARAVQSGKTDVVVRLDRDLAHRTAILRDEARSEFVSSLAVEFARPAVTASLETGFGVEPSAYHRKLFFPAGSRFTIRSEEPRGTDGVRLLIEVDYPRDRAPVYVSDIRVVWHGPTGSPAGAPASPSELTPRFSSGYFEAGHPFLGNPGYLGYELELESGIVRTATLRVEMGRDSEHGWTISELTPVVSENRYWD